MHKSGAKRRRHLLGFAFMACRAVAIGRNSDAGFCHDPSQLYYWRKHPELHGWMEKLYRETGGAAQSFNCVRMVHVAPETLVLSHANIYRGRSKQPSRFITEMGITDIVGTNSSVT